MSCENASVIEYFVDEIKRLRKENTDLKELLKQYEKENLELKEKIELVNIKNQKTITNDYVDTKRDKTKYMFKGKIYTKNQLVLAILHEYFISNINCTAEDLMETFHCSLQGSLGVVRKLDDVKIRYKNYEKRFFIKDKDILHTSTGDCCVCSQWYKKNINSFCFRANQLGFEIEKISR